MGMEQLSSPKHTFSGLNTIPTFSSKYSIDSVTCTRRSARRHGLAPIHPVKINLILAVI